MEKKSLKQEDARGLQVWRNQVPPRMSMAHLHADLEMNLVLEGEPLRYLQRGRIVEIPVGRLAMFWGGIPHQLLSPDTAVDGVWLTLPLPWVLQWDLPGDPVHEWLAGEVWMEREGADDPGLTLRWVEDFASGDPHRLRVMRLEIEARVYRMVLNRNGDTARNTGGAGNPGEARLQEITACLAERYTESLRVDEIAKSVGLNPRYMMRLFKDCTGMTVWEYLLRLRVAHAQQQLIAGNDKIINIALASGFETLSAFYRAFREYGGGDSPGEFRGRHRNAPDHAIPLTDSGTDDLRVRITLGRDFPLPRAGE